MLRCININHRLRIIAEILPFAVAALFKSGPVLSVLLIVITILSGLMPAATVYVGRLVLDAVACAIKSQTPPAQISALVRALVMQLITLLLAALLSRTDSFVGLLVARRLWLNMNAELLTKVSSLDYAFFQSPRFYDMVTRAQAESNGKPLILVSKLNSVVRGLVTFVSMGGLVASFSLTLLADMIVVCLPLLLIQLRYGEKIYSLQYDRTEDSRMAGYVAAVMTTAQHIPEILGFGLWRHLFGKWHTSAKKFLQQDVHLQKHLLAAELVPEVLMALSTVAAAAYIIFSSLTKNRQLTLGDIMMYSGAFAGSLAGLKAAAGGLAGIYENALFLHNLVEFNRLKPRIEISQQAKPAPEVVNCIEFQNVSFKYPGGQEYALKNVNLTFSRPGTTLIVGANGAGKTTLNKLLIRLYDPTQGRILLNGIDLRCYNLESLRKTIGVAFQQFICYPFSARENIACGAICKLHDTDSIIDAARRANAHSIITRLPQQYETILSRLFNSGQELSLGQWQRICLARLFLKNPSVFIFDEPTACLDIRTEDAFLKEIALLSQDRICILVSHRLLRPGIADQIVVLDNGKVTEKGAYHELVAQNGEFARLCRLYQGTTEEFAPQPLPVS
jgi:ATP-binding cassette subfamily B protein